jgi:hypothetical protein
MSERSSTQQSGRIGVMMRFRPRFRGQHSGSEPTFTLQDLIVMSTCQCSAPSLITRLSLLQGLQPLALTIKDKEMASPIIILLNQRLKTICAIFAILGQYYSYSMIYNFTILL